MQQRTTDWLLPLLAKLQACHLLSYKRLKADEKMWDYRSFLF